MKYHTYLYCTKAKPYLFSRGDYPYEIPEKDEFILRTNKQIKRDIVGDQPYVDGGEFSFQKRELMKDILNGSVCFECETEEAFDISKVVQTNKNLSLKIRDVYDTEEVTLYRGLKTALTLKQIEVYQGTSKRLYAIHLENVRSIDPFPITNLYKDKLCEIPLTRAPQSYCFAYGIYDRKPVKVLVFSVQSPWICKIGNGKKDLEIRKGCPYGLEVK